MKIAQPSPRRARDLRLGDYVIDPGGKSTVRIAGIHDVTNKSGTLLYREFRMRPYRHECVQLSPDTEVPVVMSADDAHTHQVVAFRITRS